MTTRLARTFALVLTLAAVITIFSTDTARAQWGFGGFGYGNGYGSSYNIYTSERVPFYAISPPVYYKHPVPRPYGYSPFAYPPGVMTPPRSAAPPEIVVNQYVPQPAAAEPSAAPAPLVIKNPFVTP